MRSSGRGAGAVLLVVLALCGSLLVGCSDDHDSADTSAAATRPVTMAEAQQVLDERAQAIRDNDLTTFLHGIDTSNRALVRRQRRYFANMQRLPLAVLNYRVLKAQWPGALRSSAWGKHVLLPQVRVATQLEGFDVEPVQRVTGFAFARRDGTPVVVSELTGRNRQFPGYGPAPWDLVRIHVRSDDGTLQVYDDDTWARAGTVGRTLRRGIRDVVDGVPWTWSGHVVVYVFAKKQVLNSYEGVPGGNINHLGAMTFPMYSVLGREAVAGVRFTLLPSSLRAGQSFLDRIVRHELTHVAVGPRDDGAPTWIAEGISEYMGVRELPEDQRRIATVATRRARGAVNSMPASAGFNGHDQAWNYALAWMACDYIVATQGEPRLWELMDALHAGGEGTSDARQDAVLTRVIGMDSHELARHAAERIVEIYG